MTPERKAIIASAAILVFGGVGYWANGMIYSSAEAMDMIETLRDSALYLGSAMATSSGTTLALMLTLVGFIQRLDTSFSHGVYKRIGYIALFSTFSLAGSVVLLLVLTLPIGEFDKLPSQWYPILYTVIYSLVIVLSALLVGTVTLVFGTVMLLINSLRPEAENTDD